MNQYPTNVSIVEAIVNLARNLGVKTIAEWAKNGATLETLAEIGVDDYVQGFVITRSKTPEQLLKAASAASFIQDEKLQQLIGQPGDPLGSGRLILEDTDAPRRKVH